MDVRQNERSRGPGDTLVRIRQGGQSAKRCRQKCVYTLLSALAGVFLTYMSALGTLCFPPLKTTNCYWLLELC